MDDIYATELLRQNLTDALEREDNLKQVLEAAETEKQSLRNHAREHKARYQKLDDLLEAEEAKTHAERLGKQEAEETTRQHRAECLKLRRNEAIANQHCEAAESEVINLHRDLSTERAAVVAAGRLSARLREELRQAEANGMAAYDMLNTARARIFTLEQDLKLATDRISVQEQQAREYEERVEKERQRMAETQTTLSATTPETNNTELKYSDLMEKYTALAAEHSKCHPTDSAPVTNPNTASVADETQSPVLTQTTDPTPSTHAQESIRTITENNEETTTVITATSRTAAKDRVLNSPQPELPTFPERAILRPQLASVTNLQVEIFKATGKIMPVADTKNLRWKFFWRLPGNLLRFLIPDSGRC